MIDTKNQILEVAEDLIRRQGLNAMSYQHISDAVGIRKASIHHHFPKKNNLVEALLTRCQNSYGNSYKTIVEGPGTAPAKLRLLAGIFAEGLVKQQLCLVGTISSDLNTLQDNSRMVLESTIKNTVDIYKHAFTQGREERSLTFSDTDENMAYAYYSFLLGAQISARAHGGVESFNCATEALISSWE
ncbi:MAG: TetR/AcrR family transcriptional regulator [Spirochaetales bacterium]|nr:TetR/AcrR family transcriptional regulator [Spirochaetales bacterium]